MYSLYTKCHEKRDDIMKCFVLKLSFPALINLFDALITLCWTCCCSQINSRCFPIFQLQHIRDSRGKPPQRRRIVFVGGRWCLGMWDKTMRSSTLARWCIINYNVIFGFILTTKSSSSYSSLRRGATPHDAT